MQSERQLNSIKSVLLVVLMLTMSLSAGIVEINRAPWMEPQDAVALPLGEPPVRQFSSGADWELLASEETLETTVNAAMTPITFNWTAWSSGVANSTSSLYTSGDSGWYNSIVIDSNDKAHIVFYRDDNSNLMYSTNKSGSWATSSIETSNNVGKYCNLAIDSNDGLHVSYQYNTGTALKYAYKSASSSSWSKTTIDNTGGTFTSIAIDSNDKPHIAYRDSGGDLGYAEKTGSSWSFSSVQSAGDIAFTSIAIDSSDDIHIAYYDASNKDMFHFTDTSGSWVRTNLEDIGTNTGGTALDIAIDPTTDEPGISYFDMDATSLKYTYYTGSSWSASTVENGADYGRFNSIAYDSLGNVHISHELNGADDLYYTSDKTGSWVSTPVHTTNSAGTHTSIAVDGNDDIHIAYRYNSGSALYHATVQGYNSGSVTRTAVSGATCSISPSLPNGLTLNQGTCTVSGTPTTSGSNLTYNLTATSSTGVSKTGEFNLWVTLIAPSIAYSGSPFTFTEGTAISSITPTNTGDSATWSISPSLPNGLNIDSSTGVISGTPTVTASSASYVITATNSGGSDTATISLTVNAQAPSGLSYATENMTLEKGTAMTPNLPSVGGGTVTSWEISPSLPSGLTWGTSDGKISGTPTVLQTTATTYTIWANNSGGEASANVNITINDAVPVMSYSTTEITETKNVAISPSISPTTSGGTITSWEISPSPGSAFTFNTATGTIDGTPTSLLSRTQYTIWANNSGGSAVAYLNITVNDVAPNTIVYSSHDLTLEKGTLMTTTTPAISGGSVTTWEINPSIPSGMAFSASTGAISGTPSVLQTTAVTYTIWANNSGGWTSTEMNITINDQVASITYPSTVEVSNDRAMTTVTPTNTGGAVSTWEIHPSLPTGLNFGSSNGSIWGTPTGLLENVTYTVYANNSGGSPSTTFILGLNWTLTPSAEGAYITRNSSIASDITWEWDYDPLEAQNLSLVTGEWNTCALDSNQNVFCWGRNGNGQIGNGQTGTAACGTSGHKCKDVPTATNDLGSDVISLAFGHQHACGLLDTGAVKCWGRNNAGQLGTSGGDKDTPQTINLGSGRTATSIYAGGHYTCAILDDESVKCWGQNDQGQLGIGSTSNANTPTTINTLGSGRTAVSLATAFDSVCALLDDGSVKCWGSDFDGQLGNGGTNADLSSPPSSAINLGTSRTAKAITGGEFHFCAILDDDSIKCWGQGTDGKLGTGSTGDRSTPTSTSGSFASGRYAVAIDAGYDHTCVLLDNGDMTCWGSDADGQLGNGASSSSTVSSLSSNIISLGTGRTAISISAGGTHTCAQLDNGQLKCWGNRADGQVGDNGNFNNPSDRTSPSSVSSNNHGGNTYLNTGVMPSSAVTGATCEISPSLPTGLSLTAGTCTITGTPTATAINATYTVWANVSGQSFSGQIWLEVGLNGPDISYSSSSYTYTKDIEITSLIPSNVGGEVTTWAINATLPSGLTFETSNGTIWGTPDTITTATTYTIWANNSADSDSFTITFTVNAATPNFYYGSASGGGAHTLVLYLDQTMNPLTPTQASGGGAITSCSSSPSLPSGLSLSSTCVLSGTPDATATGAFYTITGTNTGGSDTASLYIEIRSYGGTLSVTPSNTEGSVNSSISDITMSYAHQISNYGWTSGVSNTTTTLSTNFLTAGGTHLLGLDSGDQGEMVVVYAHNDTSSASGTYSLAMMYRWGGTWTETILDTGTDTGYHPSVAIDRQGAIHIAYIDDHNDKLRYATNASGSWVFTTLGSSTYDNDDGRGTAIVVHPITDVVHIVTTINDNTYRDLQYHTNEDGSWVNMTITNTLSDEGHDPAMAMDGDGNLHVVYYCDDGCSDLRMSSRINGVWQNETVASTLNIGNDPDITIDSQGTIHIVSQYLNNKRIYLHSGTPGSWTEQTGLSGGNAHYPVVSVDSNDAVHISYHFGNTQKDVMYMTNASGSWSTASMIEGYGGWGSEMAIDDNDDIFIANLAVGIWNELQLTTVKGSGQGLTVRPIYDISPMLPDGLTMNWRNGTVSGTPTEALANTTFTVTVTALGTTTTSAFTLFITGAPGAIAYSDISGTKGTAITPVTPAITTNGTTGSVTSWAISPALPSGLSFGTSNGTIWGTPTVVVSGDVFTIWANNSVGSKSTTVNITVNDEAPDISYNPDWFVLTNNTAMSPTATPTNSGGAIPSTAIDSTGNSGAYTSIAIDSYGFRHISYQDTTNYDLKYATDKTGSWVTVSVDTIGYVGDTTSIAIDSNDVVHISYVENYDDLKYATCSSGCTTASNWDIVFVDTTDSMSMTSIAIDSNDALHISYLDYTNKDLKYATCSSGCTSASNWNNVSIDTTGDRGWYSSIAIDSNDAVHISYYDLSGKNLKYATCSSSCTTASNWDAVLVDTTGYVGLLSSIAIDSNDAVHISYYHIDMPWTNTHDDLKYATCSSTCTTASNWDIVYVDTTGDVGRYSSIAIDSNDAVHISYQDGTNGGLKYATCSSGCATVSNWNNVSVTSGFGVDYTSIAIDSNDAVRISYRDTTNGDLKYVVLDSSSNIYGYSVSPTLPAGLSLDIATGEISGTPTELLTNTTFTITARNSGGTNTTTITIVVNDEVPTIAYSPNDLDLTNNTVSSDLPLSPTITGSGEITSWEINATLPAGLTFETSNGTIWGTPSELWTQTAYTVWANNTGGSAVAYLNITVVDELPTIAYSPNDLNMTNNTASSDLPLSPTVTGSGEFTSWAINASLPSGLTFETSNGTIWGTPTELWTQTAYTVWANNTGGSAVAYLNITVVDQVPSSVSYSPVDLTLTNNTASSDLPLSPTITGSGEITSWEINASSSSGLTFETSNGTIWGTPTELWTQTAYTVWANNTGGSAVAYLNITVVDQVPSSVSYSPADLTLTNNTASSDLPLSPTITGSGEITSWEINASLPSGLTFETSNGTIWGTPTELWTQTAYTVWANNTGGSAVAYLNITVVDELPTIAYSPNDLDMTNNTASSDLPLSPTITGSGEITSWEINASSSERTYLRDQQRYDLGNTDRTVDANGLHGLGQQHRWVRRRLPQHHRG
ncbi:putative Ig domain-containing protein [Candidatus Poseidonia alphae]|uniref:putative Ig domain-containing protein n=1 Tax=Candidatus Poseidonia alphae TaxID=1915863 RepID=UPI0030C66B6B